MADQDAARGQLETNLDRVRRVGYVILAVGLLVAYVVLPLGIGLVVVGLLTSITAGFAKGYYLGE